MPAEKPRMLVEVDYYQAAQEYLRSLPLEHFMESTPQAAQRAITLESLALVQARRPDVHVFNELLVQYRIAGQRKPGQVVPDNMVVIHDGPIDAEGSYDVPLQPVRPFWVLEYVSKSNQRKDYDENKVKYEDDLKVPYYLLFMPKNQELTLYRHNKKRYLPVVPDANDRCAIKELELEVGLLGGWVRFWHQGKLLPLPAEWQRSDEEKDRHIAQLTNRAEAEAKRAEAEAERAEAEKEARLAAERELAELRAQLRKTKD